jgi:hypothetical protein
VKRASLLAAAVLVCLVARSSAAPEDASPPRRIGVAALETSIKRTQARLATLAGLAEQPPEALLVRAYLNYPADVIGDRKNKREVRADTLLEKVIENKDVPDALRREAQKAILARASEDADLVEGGERGSRRPRARFSLGITKHLARANDPFLRVLARDLLVGLWPKEADPDITRYDPDLRATWDDARRRWEKVLR